MRVSDVNKMEVMCFGWSPAQTIMAENNHSSRAAFGELIDKVLSLLLAA